MLGIPPISMGEMKCLKTNFVNCEINVLLQDDGHTKSAERFCQVLKLNVWIVCLCYTSTAFENQEKLRKIMRTEK